MLPLHGGGFLSLSAKKVSFFLSFFPRCLQGFPKPHLFVYDYSILKITSAATMLLRHHPQCSVSTGDAEHPSEAGKMLGSSRGCGPSVSNVSQEYKKSLFSVVSQQLQIKESSEKYIEVAIPLLQLSLLPFQPPLLFVFP